MTRLFVYPPAYFERVADRILARLAEQRERGERLAVPAFVKTQTPPPPFGWTGSERQWRSGWRRFVRAIERVEQGVHPAQLRLGEEADE